MRVSTLGTAIALASGLALSGCGGSSSSPSSAVSSSTSSSSSSGSASVSAWTWVGGSQSSNQVGTYGTQGQAAKANMPGAREYPQTWNDSNGHMWLFGGFGYESDGQGALNDLWKYDSSSGEWTWVSGANTVAGSSGSYGTQGASSPSNEPPGREDGATWIDGNGNLWLMGGYLDGVSGYGNDLWKYDVSIGQWIWMKGSQSTNQPGTYGTQGQAASSNEPGARRGAVTWVGPNGDLWLFGGHGYDSTGTEGYLDDLWKYDPSTNQWTWVDGTDKAGTLAVYGQQGTAASSNDPGARTGAVSWNGPNGNLWLFGGINAGSKLENDVWEYNVSTKQWTWVSGSNKGDQNGTYGTQGTPASSNIPGGRYWASAWADKNGNFWLFGGLGYDASSSTPGSLNDLWEYSPKTNEWTWVSGSKSSNASSTYGTQGQAAAGNTPGGREAAGAWLGADGTTLWFFGGQDYNLNDYNDLWKYQQ